MTISYTWSVIQMRAYPEKDNETDVVFQVAYAVNGVDESGISATVYNSVDVPLDSGSPFTPYDQLTQEQVLEWVQSALTPTGVESVEDSVAASIAGQKNPPVVSPPLPWAATPLGPTPINPEA